MKPKFAQSHEEIMHALSHPAALLYFYHDECPPCRTLRPKVEQFLTTRFPEMQLVLVNGLSLVATAMQWQVYSFPTMIGFFEGKEYFRKSKFVSLIELEQAIDRPYQLLFSQA